MIIIIIIIIIIIHSEQINVGWEVLHMPYEHTGLFLFQIFDPLIIRIIKKWFRKILNGELQFKLGISNNLRMAQMHYVIL